MHLQEGTQCTQNMNEYLSFYGCRLSNLNIRNKYNMIRMH